MQTLFTFDSSFVYIISIDLVVFALFQAHGPRNNKSTTDLCPVCET